MKTVLLTIAFNACFFLTIAQSSDSLRKKTFLNNVFTTGFFMSRGQLEVKQFNNLYTETAPFDTLFSKRGSYFTSFMQITIGSNKNINYGIDVLYKSNISEDLATGSPFKVLSFEKRTELMTIGGEQFTTSYNHGLSHIGGRLRTKPFREKRFTIQQAIYVPTGKIDAGWIINSDLFFEYITTNKKIMFFSDLGVWYNTAQQPFPYLKVFAGTLLARRLGPYCMINLPYEIGPGIKFFIHPKFQLELLYTWWLPLEWTVQDSRPQTFNLGFRFTNFNNF